MPKLQSTTSVTTRTTTTNVTTVHSEQSLGPNLQSRLEALEAAMGVRLNVAKRQGRQSLSNTTSSSPMQISPTSTSSSATLSIATTTTTTTSLSTSSRHNIPSRSGQGVQRSASSCDVENRPGPIKRLKPSVTVDNSSTPTASAIATIKKYTPPVRRPLTTTVSQPRPVQSKQTISNKQRTLPMETTATATATTGVTRASRSTTVAATPTHHSTTTTTAVPRPTNVTTPKVSHTAVASSVSTPVVAAKPVVANPVPPPPPRPATFPRKQRLSIFGEQFSDDILKINLLWININELDDEGRMEVLIQFGSMENFFHEQQLFSAKQQQQMTLAAKNKSAVNRSRLQTLIPKKDRLELL